MQYSHPGFKTCTFSITKKRSKRKDFLFFPGIPQAVDATQTLRVYFALRCYLLMCVNLFYVVRRYIHVLHVKTQGGYHQFSINEIVQHFLVHKSILVCLYNFVRLTKNVMLKSTLLFLESESITCQVVEQ